MTAIEPDAAEASVRSAPGPRADALSGVLIGTAVGDSLGLPLEGLSPRRQQRLFDPPLRQRLIGHFGMCSDDTEHTFLLAQALLECPLDSALFQSRLARRLRWWLACLPAGVGFATLRAILKLWVGVSPERSGVMSAGNGAAMRTALLGVYFADDDEQRRAFVRASTQITHRDPRAEVAALAVAEVAAWMTHQRDDTDPLLKRLSALSDSSEWTALITKIQAALSADQPAVSLAQEMGCSHGVSGYAFHSVPVAIYIALQHRTDFAAALEEAIALGGDTDTIGAITGALVGARVGLAGIPPAWRAGVVDWPCSIAVLQKLALRLNDRQSSPSPLGPVPWRWPALPFRNIAFLAIVLAHGLRRLLPPY